MQKRYKKFCAAALSMLLLCLCTLTGFAADSNSHAGTVRITSGRLNVRSAPSTASAVVSSLYKDETVTLLQKSGDFWKIEYANGAYGYASARYVQEIAGSYGARVKTSGGNLNVRRA